ncbi:hypothetical protein L0337_09260 [candidate division KSB1 bacterium]|nr:hypothetical protein [candidate division KSB1 bacterium]
MAARDFSRAGQTFIDHKGRLHEILYSLLTPLGYQAHVSVQTIRHIEKHWIAAQYQNELPHLLNNPDLIVPNFEIPTAHLYYKAVQKTGLVAAVHEKEGNRYVATMHKAPTIKGLKEKKIFRTDFLYVRGGFKWKKWK